MPLAEMKLVWPDAQYLSDYVRALQRGWSPDKRDSVDIHAEKGGLVVVRKRAFNGSIEQQHFIELASQYLKTAQTVRQLNGAS
jgi:hypothetical protein